MAAAASSSEREANERLQAKAKAIYEAEMEDRRLPEAEAIHMQSHRGRHEPWEVLQLHGVRTTATVQSLMDSYSLLSEKVFSLTVIREPKPFMMDIYLILLSDVERMAGGVGKMVQQLPLPPSQREKGYVENLVDYAIDHVHWSGNGLVADQRRTHDLTIMSLQLPLVVYMYEA